MTVAKFDRPLTRRAAEIKLRPVFSANRWRLARHGPRGKPSAGRSASISQAPYRWPPAKISAAGVLRRYQADVWPTSSCMSGVLYGHLRPKHAVILPGIIRTDHRRVIIAERQPR